MQTVIVIGGGAAGLMAAITAAETGPGNQVTILEKSPHTLAKVKISGGGRCNVTNALTDPGQLAQFYPRGSSALRGPLTRFGSRETWDWFEQRGVKLKAEADGRVFPITDNSQTIIDCLLNTARQAGVRVQINVPILSIHNDGSGFKVTLRGGESLGADKLLLATGSNRQGQTWAQALGHSVAPPVPSLFTFNIKDKRLEGLAGVAVPSTELRLSQPGSPRQTGPTLITHWGLSGPAVLKLSAWAARALAEAHYRAELSVNWLPEFEEDQLRTTLTQMKEEHPRKGVETESPVPLPQRLWGRLAAAAGIEPARRWTALSKKEVAALIDQLLRGKYLITGKGVFKEEFVTCGGINLKEVNFKTMESKICPGLYFAGEILDIDGVTGGFNFQSAWTTGWVAGRAMGA